MRFSAFNGQNLSMSVISRLGRNLQGNRDQLRTVSEPIIYPNRFEELPVVDTPVGSGSVSSPVEQGSGADGIGLRNDDVPSAGPASDKPEHV